MKKVMVMPEYSATGIPLKILHSIFGEYVLRSGNPLSGIFHRTRGGPLSAHAAFVGFSK